LKKQPTTKTKQYGIYSVLEEWQPNGSWSGYKVGCVSSEGKKQGKLYIKSDGREFYKAEKKKDEDLEL